MRYQRNADEGMRRRERLMAAVPTQESIDRVVVDKLRSGRPGEITLFELQRASLSLIPRDVLQRALQSSFDKLWNGVSRGDTSPSKHALLECEGAGISIFNSGEPEETLVVSVDTAGMNEDYVWPGPHEIPRVRFYANEGRAETEPGGGWDFS